jgi:hypothetical protein
MGKIPATHSSHGESSSGLHHTSATQQVYEEQVVPLPRLAELPIDCATSIPEDGFLGALDPSVVSSDDGSSLLDPPPAYGPSPQNWTVGVNCE